MTRKSLLLTLALLWSSLAAYAGGEKLYFGATETIPGVTIISTQAKADASNPKYQQAEKMKRAQFTPYCVFFNNGTDQKTATLPSPNYVLGKVYESLENRVYRSSTRSARENANAVQLGKIDLSQNMQTTQSVMANNYAIVLDNRPDGKKGTAWTLYRLAVPDDCASLMIQNNGSTRGINAKWVEEKTGIFKDSWDLEKDREKFSQACPVFALGAQVVDTKSHNTAARIGTGDIASLSSGDRFYAYRTVLDKKTEQPVSKRIGVMRAIKISNSSMRDTNNDSTLFMQIAGLRTPSSNYGDVLVYTPDKRMATGVAGTFQKGMVGAKVDFDWMVNMSRMGFAGYAMATLGVKVPYKNIGNWYVLDAEGEKEQKHLTGLASKVDHIIVPYLRLGYGLGFHFWHCFEVRPYVMIGAEIPMLLTVSETKELTMDMEPEIFCPYGYHKEDPTVDELSRTTGINVTGTAGVRFTLNINYPLQVYLGAEYTYGYPLSDWEKDLNSMILKPIGINQQSNFGLYAGLKWCF